MRQQTSLHIPTPCHEDWNKMSPAQQGKFCASCCKQVVDFTLMSDQQILNYLSSQSGKLCGRFDSDQLQRPLVETKIKKKKSWWMALTMPLLFLFEKNEARSNLVIKADTTVSPIEKVPEIMGKLMYQPSNEITLAGKVVDEKNQPVPFATIVEKGTLHGIASDSNGNFALRLNSADPLVWIAASAIGYEPIERLVDIIKDTTISITLQMNEAVSGEVVVVGGLASYQPVKLIDTIKTSVKQILHISNFKIYPNPVSKFASIQLEIEHSGQYQLQLFDNQSRIIKVEEIDVPSEKFTTSIQLPSSIAAGMYYLRLIDQENKKQYTEKLIIQ